MTTVETGDEMAETVGGEGRDWGLLLGLDAQAQHGQEQHHAHRQQQLL